MIYDFIIMGGGISGLTTGFLLSKHLEDKKILLIEKQSELGGLIRDEYNDGLYKEHSPRVFLSNYENFYNIIKQIPCENNKTIYDNLTEHMNNIIVRKNGGIDTINDLFFKIDIKDTIKLIYYMIYGLLSCDKRIEYYDDISFFDILSKESKDKLRIMSHIVGENPTELPLFKIYKLIESTLNTMFFQYTDNSGKPRTFKGPYIDTLIKPWEKYLINNNVEIKKNTEIINLHKENDLIKSIKVKEENGDFNTYYGKNYISSLDIFGLNKILDNKFSFLEYKTVNHQYGIQLYFDKKIEIKNYGYFSLDTDWQLIIEPCDKIWDEKHMKKMDKNIKSIWSINIADENLYSNRLGKKIKECSNNEIINEVLFQINDFLKSNLEVYDYNIWDYNTKYFWNNISTNKMRPTTKINNIKNLFINGAITKTSYYNSFVEGGVESGYIVAKKFIPKLNYYKHKSITDIFKKIDEVLYYFKLPSIFTLLFLMFLLMFVVPHNFLEYILRCHLHTTILKS